MAERRAERSKPADGTSTGRARGPARRDEDGQPSRPGRPRSVERLTAARAARLGLQQIAELTGKVAECVAAVEPSDDGWTVGVEVIEDSRIPSSTDVLAIYQAEVSPHGELVSYRRLRRYRRGQGDTDYGGESW